MSSPTKTSRCPICARDTEHKRLPNGETALDADRYQCAECGIISYWANTVSAYAQLARPGRR